MPQASIQADTERTELESKARVFHLLARPFPECEGDIRFVGRLVFGKARVAVDSHHGTCAVRSRVESDAG